MMKRFWFGWTLVLSFCVSACAGAPDPVPDDRSQEWKDEVRIGREIASRIAGQYGLYSGPGAEELSTYVNLVGASLVPHSSRPEVEYRFAILNSEEINAFAAPGGYLFVTLGLLKEIRSEDELAGVLGHEIAHITERHLNREVLPKRDVQASEIFTRMLSRGASDLAFSMTRLVQAGLETLLEKGLGPEREHEADLGGIVVASAAGYEPRALGSLLTRLKKRAESESLPKTHPPFPERLAKLKLATPPGDAPASKPFRLRLKRFRECMAPITGRST
jgi:predicted Zn-dependent protease